MTEFSTSQESAFAASPEQYNSSPIDLARMGAYVLTTATSTQAAPNSTWVSDLTNNTTNPSFSFSGVVSEVIVFNRKLTEEERQVVYAYLSQKYQNLERVMPDSFATSHYGAYATGQTYWHISPHPNSHGHDTINFGSEFSGIILNSFLNMPRTIYQSLGTVQPDGTTLSGDTYEYMT